MSDMSTSSSTIRLFVQWTQQTVFAGEDIECQITFKNVATTPAPSRTTLHPAAANGFVPGVERQSKAPAAPAKTNLLTLRAAPSARGHRTTLSLNAPLTSMRSPPPGSAPWTGGHSRAASDRKSHQRSISIKSIAASESAANDATNHVNLPEGPRRLSKGHGRSASLQIVPRRNGYNGGPNSAPLGQRSSTQPSPLLLSSFSPINSDYSLPDRPARRQAGVSAAPSTPSTAGASFTRRKSSTSSPLGFKFPAATPTSADARAIENFGMDRIQEGSQILSPRAKDAIPTISEQSGPPTARILSPASITGTPRSSGEFYSVSNNSTETLASEYMPPQHGQFVSNGHTRRPSNLASLNHHRPPETLMMGYAQIHGSFTLDGSLISLAPFEDVKRKGAVGGQGGGVIGVERSKRDSGLLGGFGWANIGESLGSLLGSGELSSIKDMRGIASSRSIPLLSTPQSILFVDLRLAPGESKTYKYSIKLPKGLPPSHRGKAIKISYTLVIGTQRPGGAKEQQVTSVEVPFRILGSVNSHGELLGHDLMSPYIILRDQARLQTIESPSYTNLETSKGLQTKSNFKKNESTLNDFMYYVDELLRRPRQNSSLGLLSPTEAPRSLRQSSIEEPTTAKEAIDMAILRSNAATESQQSANRFEIARSGKRVAVVMLARPAYRLGETITAAIDFTDAEIPCYAIHAALETSEKVDNSIALRSEASILRVTRKIHASHSESSLFARRIVFSPTIPMSATPEFITSGVSLDWRIRIEFVTPQLTILEDYTDLLEEVARDDRTVTLNAAESIECDSFEIAVPLRVYGAITGNTERDESPSEGLVV